MELLTMQEMDMNRVLLRGILLEEPEFSHESHGKSFDKMVLSVKRLSGTFDHLNVIAEHSAVEALQGDQGPMLEVQGQIRFYNNHSGIGQKLRINVFAENLFCCQGEPENAVTLRGVICKEPIYRRTPLGRETWDVILAVERKYRRRDYIPCILWGSVARMASECSRGTMLEVQGRLQSREYTKQTEQGPESRTAFEVSAITAEIL